jgi:hypothetical protein
MPAADWIPRLLVTLAIVTANTAFAIADEKASRKPAESTLTIAEFEQLHQKLTRMSHQRVWSVPWQLSVREARELAAKENKPVFLWISSNGGTHPLGPC